MEKQLGVGHGAISKWKREPEFLNGVLQRAREYARISHTPEIIEKTAKVAKQGNQQAVTNYFKYIEQIADITELILPKKVSDILADPPNDKRGKTNPKPPADSQQKKTSSKVHPKRSPEEVRQSKNQS